MKPVSGRSIQRASAARSLPVSSAPSSSNGVGIGANTPERFIDSIVDDADLKGPRDISALVMRAGAIVVQAFGPALEDDVQPEHDEEDRHGRAEQPREIGERT